jgi:hypothetical protein
VERLRVEVEAAVRPVEGQWRTEPVTARHLATVRRVLDTLGRRDPGEEVSAEKVRAADVRAVPARPEEPPAAGPGADRPRAEGPSPDEPRREETV